MAPRAVHLAVAGRVQGVGYRAWLAREAGRRGLGGWVRNRPDGTVEAVLHGEAEAVEALVALCRRGPRDADVSDVRSEAYDGLLPSGFKVLPTG